MPSPEHATGHPPGGNRRASTVIDPFLQVVAVRYWLRNAALIAGYFGASGHSPVIGPKASSPFMTLTTL
jgi:hypothetical protein